MQPRIAVFAYHNIGVACLEALIEAQQNIVAVYTHHDNPQENIWFDSVASLAKKNNLNLFYDLKNINNINFDIIYSFYYRDILNQAILDKASMGAFNLHGSLLPYYRGRCPVNWAILKGETQTGVTLHKMTAKPDAGDIVAQKAVDILPDDTSFDIFNKLTPVAKQLMSEQITPINTQTNQSIPQDLSRGTYYSGRKRCDGEINWNNPAQEIHNLIRAVTKPYPGAFGMVNNKKTIIWRSKINNKSGQAGHIISTNPLIIAAGTESIEILEHEDYT